MQRYCFAATTVATQDVAALGRGIDMLLSAQLHCTVRIGRNVSPLIEKKPRPSDMDIQVTN